MATATHNFTVGQEVYHVDATNGVKEAVVRKVTIEITQTGTSIEYDIAYSKAVFGSALVLENTLYADVDLALAAYKPTVVVP